MIQRVSLKEAEYVAHKMARELMDYGEPVADFRARYPGRLESCLEQPFTYLNGRFVYWTISHRAAVLFYLLIKNHPFENGNKRMAVTIMLTFFYKNGRWISIAPDALYRIAKIVAESPPYQKDIVIKLLKTTFRDHLVRASIITS
ncbi:type II toxin-antitoxin system death-on-curing family toxin [Streptomyces sp. NPDC051644]|uniref:type II toxin-antitoxin system death-on-curing family toxin n=1 Tax=Streptomyces sp. NPDC051644 TaxID=3365666 RepID=UPI0037991683